MIPFLQRGIGGRGSGQFVRMRDEADAADLRADRGAPRDDAERDDMLSMLLAARHEDGSPMSHQELRDELMTLLVAGHETTASELAWAFERLTREPAVLVALVEEIDARRRATRT